MSTFKYTYSMFASDVIGIANGEIEITAELAERLKAKATDLLNVQTKKAAHKVKRLPKGPSDETLEKGGKIQSVLSNTTPMTAAEINTALGTNFTASQIANAVKYTRGIIKSCKVVRETTNSKGLKRQKEYIAYYLA